MLYFMLHIGETGVSGYLGILGCKIFHGARSRIMLRNVQESFSSRGRAYREG